MKGKVWFVLAMIAFMVLMFIVEYNQPKRFSWKPTFARYDKQPFGCSVFDDVVYDAWPEQWWVSRESFYQLTEDSTNYAILAVAMHMDLSKTDVEALLELAERGSKILLAATSFSIELTDTLHFRCRPSYYSIHNFRKYVSDVKHREAIYWVGDTARFVPRPYHYYPQLCSSYFTKYDSQSTLSLAEVHVNNDWSQRIMSDVSDTLAVRADSLTASVALSIPVGKGEIILSSTPLLFTNYGVLDGNNATYVFRLLSCMSDLPLLRTEVYGSPSIEPQSPLRYFLSQPSLRWALYLTLATLILFMIFTARRRQRAIPVLSAPDNKTLEFTELVGTLYFQKKDHSDLICKKFTYFAEQLRRSIQADAEDETDDEALCRRIARKTGLDEQRIRVLFRGLRPLLHGESRASEELMKEYINRMNEIINHL